jgi:hypothetical protein
LTAPLAAAKFSSGILVVTADVTQADLGTRTSAVTYIRLDCSEKSCQQLEWRIKAWILPQVITESSRDFPVEN